MKSDQPIITENPIDKKDPVYLANRQADYQRAYRIRKKLEDEQNTLAAKQAPVVIQQYTTAYQNLQADVVRLNDELRAKDVAIQEVTTNNTKLADQNASLTNDNKALRVRETNLLTRLDQMTKQQQDRLAIKQKEIDTLRQRNLELEQYASLGIDFSNFKSWLSQHPDELKYVNLWYSQYMQAQSAKGFLIPSHVNVNNS